MVVAVSQTANRTLNKLAYGVGNVAATLSAAASGDLLVISDISDDYEMKVITVDNLIGTAGEAAASTALVLDASGELDWATSSASTSGSVSVEPLNFDVTMTGVGGVGGRAKFTMSTEVALGAWANALKAEVDWGTAGAVTGLGSALVAEMTLGPGSQAGGTYGVLELELNAPADSGDTNVAFIYASMQGADDDALDDAVSMFSLNGVTAGAGSIYNTFSQITNAAVQASLKIKINGTAWYIPLMDTQVGT